MKSIHTIMPSKFEIIRSYECPECQSIINVTKTVRDGKEVIADICLNCENKRLQDDCNKLYADREARKAEMIFQKFSVVTGDVELATFDNYQPKNDDQKKAKNGAIWYVQNFHDLNKGFHSMIFQGSYGLGKSHLAKAICEGLKKKYPTIFINVPELLNMIKGTFHKKSEITENELLKAVADVKLLVLDDLGAEYVKTDGAESWATDKLFQIVNARVNKPTIYTTNYNSADLRVKYGQHGGRIISRMKQGAKVVKFTGDDHRMQDKF